MRKTLVLLAAAIAIATAASAQDAANTSYDGTWAVSATTPEGRSYHAELVLKADGGSWRVFASGGGAMKNNPCLMKDFPVTVRTSSADELAFRVDGSKVIAGCPDFSATLKPADNNALDGHTGGGGTLHIERK